MDRKNFLFVVKDDRTFNRNPRGKSGHAPDSPFRPATLRLLSAPMRADSQRAGVGGELFDRAGQGVA